MVSRRRFLGSAACALGGMALAGCAHDEQKIALSAPRITGPPNFVVIFTDDQGYADVGCYGSRRIRTPRLDQMACEGLRFTDFYSAAAVCTPSRAALLTGCYPPRNSMGALPNESGKLGWRDVLFPDSTCGLHPDEVTIAEILKDLGYATGCVGKWHLGHLPPFLPTRHGFDSYYGIPYSNDMKPCPLMRGEEVIEEPADQDTITERYAEEAVRFIAQHRDRPFFLYLAHNMPHTPLHVSDRFSGKSEGGLYGDVIECIDWSVGRVLDALAENGVDGNTLVVFTSDNGPWYVRGENAGMATPFRAAKGTTYEGGMRMPCIMRWPDAIPEGSVCSELATTMDLLPTFAGLAGGRPPTDRIIDGKDIAPLLTDPAHAKTPHKAFYYYAQNKLNAVRSGPWKLKFETQLADEDKYQRFQNPTTRIRPALYDLRVDPGEQKSVYRDHKDVVKRLMALADEAREDLGDARKRVIGKNVRPIGRADG